MDEIVPTSMESKSAYFDQLKSLSHLNDGSVNGKPNDDFDAREERQRELHRNFFRPVLSLHVPDQPEQQLQQQQQEEEQREQTLPEKPNRLRNLTPRRVIAAPRPHSGKVIKGTGPGKPRPKGRLGALLDEGADVVHETPSVGAEKIRRQKSREEVVADTPMPPPTSSKRLLGDTSEGSSPSVNVKAGMTTRTTGSNKRGRVARSKARPEVEQIFQGLSFFYIPDNDIAPARRLRINRAKEFGAIWTRDLMTATHVIMEKKLEHKDVEKIWPKDGFGGQAPPKVVNEDYPLDCIQFRAIVDPSQKKYLLNGQTVVEAKENVTLLPAAPDSDAQAKSRVNSLPLKPQHHNKGKWDYVPPRGTPSQGDESLVSSPTARLGTGAVAVDSQPLVLDLENADELMKDLPKDDTKLQDRGLLGGASKTEAPSMQDELSEYILMMQEFKDLPLDVDEDDDAQSTINEPEAQADLDQRSGSENESPRKRRSSRRIRPTSKAIAFEDRFACNRAGRKDANEDNPNARIIEILQKMNGYYERVNDHWRTLAYRKAINTLKQQSAKITTEEEAYQMPSIGRRLAQKIEEIVTTDNLKRLKYAEEDPSDHALQTFLKIYGVGNKIAEQWIAQGLRTLEDVRQHVKLAPNQVVGVEHYDDLNTRIPRKEVTALGEIVKRAAARIDPAVQLIIGGSYRRGAESSHDIDLIVTKPGTESVADLKSFLNSLIERLERDKFLVARLASSRAGSDGSKWHGCCVLPKIKGLNDNGDGGDDPNGKENHEYRPIWRRIDFLLVPEVELGAALIYFTGNDIFNRSIRLLASKKGMRLNQRGLYRDVLRGPNRVKVTEGELVERRDERRIFEILGVKWREPWERWC
jgi:DNA polymerase IV